MSDRRHPLATTIDELQDGVLYRVDTLKSILKNAGLNYSIYTVRDYETYKCLNYKCGNRHNEEVEVCEKCGGKVREPLISSPRTRGGGSGPGHRRYTKEEILEIVNVARERV